MPSGSIGTQEKKEIRKAAHDAAIVSRWSPKVGPVLGERKSIAAVDLKRIKKLVCFEASGQHNNISLDNTVFSL